MKDIALDESYVSIDPAEQFLCPSWLEPQYVTDLLVAFLEKLETNIKGPC